MHTFFKSVMRGVRENIGKLISITIIIFIGVTIIAGLGTLMPTIQRSFEEELDDKNVADLILLSTSESGFSDEEIAAVAENESVLSSMAVTCADTELDGKPTRLYVYPEDAEISVLSVDGSLPSGAYEIAVERESETVSAHSIGETITIYGFEFTVTGIVSNPLIFDITGDISRSDSESELEEIYYFSDSSIIAAMMPVTDIHVRLTSCEERSLFKSSYTELAEAGAEEMKELYGDSIEVLTLEDNKSYALYTEYEKKINVIVLVFPFFFILVVALVVMSTMTRLVENDRAIIGCYRTLGVSKGKILFRYLFMTSACTVIASVLGIVVGLTGLPAVIYPAFNSLFFMPAKSSYTNPMWALLGFAAMLVVSAVVTGRITMKSLAEEPAQLLQPKAPKPGKRILLERVTFLWKRLSFRFKASFRNMFRYKYNFVMTIIAVTGSTALVFAGFSLLDASVAIGESTLGGMEEAISMIAWVLIAFAVALCAVVMYNLTNLNIGERHREIATLKVLGYNNGETAGFIYRELLMTSLIGIVLGIGVGCIFIECIFVALEMGSLADVHWYSYIGCCALVLVFLGVVDAILYPRIRSVDMAASLKSNE